MTNALLGKISFCGEKEDCFGLDYDFFENACSLSGNRK